MHKKDCRPVLKRKKREIEQTEKATKHNRKFPFTAFKINPESLKLREKRQIFLELKFAARSLPFCLKGERDGEENITTHGDKYTRNEMDGGE